jgi:hypothetical protein
MISFMRISLLAYFLILAACDGENKGTPDVINQPVDVAGILQFSDVTQAAGLAGFDHNAGAVGKLWLPETNGGGVGVLDYDLDGLQDIVLVAGANWENNKTPALRLFRNSGEKKFAEATLEAGLGRWRGYGQGITVGDYDNDGDPDIFLGNVGVDQLFRNDGGTFTEAAKEAGLASDAGWSTAVIWFDADNDGWLDLYAGNYVEWSPETDLFCSLDGQTKSYCTPEIYPGVSGRFYHNNGNGTFTDRTEKAGFANSPGKTLGAAAFDFNRDGWTDIVVANDTEQDELYVNNGDGTFTERGNLAGIAFDQDGRARAGMGIDVGAVDESGEEWIFVGNFSREMIGVFKHGGNGKFLEQAASSKIGRPSLLTLTFGLVLFDADLDGDLDLFAANGHVVKEMDLYNDGVFYRQPPHLFLNDGNGRFADAAPEMNALSKPIVGRGAATIDYDGDGDLDLVVTESDGPAYLFENNAANQGRNYVKVTVEGRESNRSGYGVQLTAIVGKRKMHRVIRSGSSYLSHREAVAVFGLGDETSLTSLTVGWPSGKSQTIDDIPANSTLDIIEGIKPDPTALGRVPSASGPVE